MTPGARSQAAIELLDAIIAAARDGGAAADTLIARYFATRRYAGSKDRRAVRELVYDAIRLCGERPVSGRAAMLLLAGRNSEIATSFDGSPNCPAPIIDREPVAEAGVAPKWLIEALAGSGIGPETQPALLNRAPLDLRINTLKPLASVTDLPAAEPIVGVPNGLRLPSGTSIEQTQAFRDGLIEVQDAGSQIVCAAAEARPGERVVDLCAGAGGKTLTLAAAMENQGTLLACDIDRSRLQRLGQRAARAGATIAATRLLNPKREAEALADVVGHADAVLIDAPCSGTGTWRRNPEARWRLTPVRLAKFVETQAMLLDLGATLVKPGGRLVFVTCSLLDAEGADQIAAFIERNAGWQTEPLALPAGRSRGAGIRLDPARDGTDGFFVARLTAPC